MTTRNFYYVGDAGLDAYVRIFNSDGLAFDFNDSTFKAIGSATTPQQVMTERTALNGTGQSGYVTALDLGAIHDGLGPMEFFGQVYDNATPAATDVAISDPLGITIELGDIGRRQRIAWAEISVKSAAGNDAQIAAWLEADGERVEIHEVNGTVFTADAGTDFCTSATHGLSNGDVLTLTTSNTLPAGLAIDTRYYVVNKTASTFQLSLTEGGAAINITDAGTGIHQWHQPTATVTVREQGAAAVKFTKSFTAADLADIGGAIRGIFEGEQGSPAFTDDRQYEVTVAITTGGQTTTTTHRRVVIG